MKRRSEKKYGNSALSMKIYYFQIENFVFKSTFVGKIVFSDFESATHCDGASKMGKHDANRSY